MFLRSDIEERKQVSGKDERSSKNNENVEVRKVKGRSRSFVKTLPDETTLKKNSSKQQSCELKGDLKGCVEKCREIAGIGAAVVAHEGTDTKLGNLTRLAKAVTEKINELEVNAVDNEE